MTDLRAQLRDIFRGRVCLVGVGNVELGDDGFGVRLVERLAKDSSVQGPGSKEINGGIAGAAADSGDWALDIGHWISDAGLCVAGTEPERGVGRLRDAGFDQVIFVDAVEFGGAPGSVILLDRAGMVSRFPQVSTHRISLGTLAGWIESNGATRVWLLGMQPGSLRPNKQMTPAMQKTLEALAELLGETARDARPRVQADRPAGPAALPSGSAPSLASPGPQPAIA
jgi:hydrogenase maturation protease